MQAQILTPNVADYQVIKNGSKWDVQCKAEPVEGCCHNPTKKAAISEMAKTIAAEVYRERIVREDVTGHVWTAEETKQIGDYAELLAKNDLCNFNSSNRQAAGRKAHFDDISTLLSHYNGFDGRPYETPSHWGILVCAGIRRTRAARVLAFKGAGLELSGDYFRVHTIVSGEERPSTSNHQTMQDAEHHIESLRRMVSLFDEKEGIAKGLDPNRHAFTIEEAKERFPLCCDASRTN
jgi:hypothetical protein